MSLVKCHIVWTPRRRVCAENEKEETEKEWGVMAGLGEGHIASHRGPWLRRSSFRHLPTKHSGRKSCAPHNNTTAPGHPHTGNLRSLPPFHGIQTHSCCQARAPTAYGRRCGGSLATRRKDVETRTQQSKENMRIMGKYTAEAFTDKVQKCTRSCVPDRFC